MIMLDKLKCKLGFHKPEQSRRTLIRKRRTTNKGRSKKRWVVLAKEILITTYCKRCGKILSKDKRWKWM